MVLMITQLFVDPALSSKISHVEGAARLLKSRTTIGLANGFEKALLMSLRGSVVAEVLLNDDHDYTRQQWDTLVQQRIDVTSNHGRLIQCLAQVPSLMKRSKAALRFGESSVLCVPELVLETNDLREQCKTIIGRFQDCLQTCHNEKSVPVESRYHVHARQLRLTALAFATGIILNCIVQALNGDNIGIRRESSHFSDGIVKLAEMSLQYRPLGSMLFLSNLTFAWMGASGHQRIDEIKSMPSPYEPVCLGHNFTN
ncbi:MAG: hypothetical protein Q9215_003203 [Flavoplaca cf. flavocitrina]